MPRLRSAGLALAGAMLVIAPAGATPPAPHQTLSATNADITLVQDLQPPTGQTMGNWQSNGGAYPIPHHHHHHHHHHCGATTPTESACTIQGSTSVVP